MLSKDIKSMIELEDIQPLLEELGCDHITQHNHSYITCSRPDGDNPQGVAIWYNNGLFTVEMYTDPSFESYNIKDIFTFIQHILGVSFPVAKAWAASQLGLSESDAPKKKKYGALEWLDDFERKLGQEDEFERILPESTLDQFRSPIHKMWRSEGVTQDTSDRFGIGYDPISDAITIPIRNSEGELVGIKARGVSQEEVRFWYIYKTKKSLYLYGFYENYEAIKKAGEVIVFESEKSVLKSNSVGIYNSVAIAGKKLSDHQAELLLRLNVKIILSLDSDVADEEYRIMKDKINFPVYFTDVMMIDNESAGIPKKSCLADCLNKIIDYKKFVTEIR